MSKCVKIREKTKGIDVNMASSRKYEMDLTTGAILPKLLKFCIPLALSGMLQLLYNAADVIVVGRFCGSTALAAVGSNGSLVNLLVNLFIGLSVGTGIVTARFYGAKDSEKIRRSVHTAMLLGVMAGLFVMVVGLTISGWMLEHVMGVPEDVLPLAKLYLRIIFLGMPAQMTYNFGASILRAVGDTKRSLYILSVSGLINVVLNLIFVTVLDMNVAGVALATIISQYISAFRVVRCLMHSDGDIRLMPSELRMDVSILKQFVRLGLPAGAQSVMFSLSNMIIQTSINSFGTLAMAGNAAAQNLDGFIYNAKNSVYQGSITFTSQNVGARQYDRISRICRTACVVVTVIGLGLGLLTFGFGRQLLAIYDPNPEVIEFGMIRLFVFGCTYFLNGIMEVFVGCMRGMGSSMLPMVVTLVGVCGLRIVWIYTIFAAFHTPMVLYSSYPVTWILTGIVHFFCYLHVKRKLLEKAGQQEAA